MASTLFEPFSSLRFGSSMTPVRPFLSIDNPFNSRKCQLSYWKYLFNKFRQFFFFFGAKPKKKEMFNSKGSNSWADRRWIDVISFHYGLIWNGILEKAKRAKQRKGLMAEQQTVNQYEWGTKSNECDDQRHNKNENHFVEQSTFSMWLAEWIER